MDPDGGEFRYVNNYGLLVCLGEGGMGEVWAARDPGGPKNFVVALKTTKQHGAEAAKVLWDEARIASLIDHPNVCRVRELGRDKDMQYLVMDYCDGGSLHDLLERQPGRMLTYALAARILANVCAGLHAAHELTDDEGQHLGVVHRDVSPQNVLISTTGQITVADFGVAKALGQAHKATETGEMKGKLSYMAPEQITSRDIDRRVDVFALGCVLYQVTLGRRPFHGEDALATLYQLLEKDLVSPRELDPDYPVELEKVVLKALKKDRSERYETAEDMQRALEHFLITTGQPLSEADVASALMAALGEQIQARKEEIRRRVRALDAGERFSERELQALSTGQPEQSLDTAAGTVTEAPPPAASRRKSSLMAAAAVFLLIGVGTMALLSGTSQESAVRSAPATGADAVGSIQRGAALGVGDPKDATVLSKRSSPDGSGGPSDPGRSAASGDAAQVSAGIGSDVSPQISLTLRVSPPTAVIMIDGQVVGTGAYQTTMERSTGGHILEVRASGYETLTRALVFDRAQDLELSLKASGPARGAGSVRPARRTPEPGTKPPKKAPRALDSENPFAVPSP